MQTQIEYGQPDEKDFAIDKRSTSRWVGSLKPTEEEVYEDFDKCPLDGKKCPTCLPSLRTTCPLAKKYGVKCPLEGKK